MIYTVGHSTRSLEELVDLLRSFEVGLLVDGRTVPRSRRNPQFNRAALERDLPPRGIAYHHLGALGGLRRPRPDSLNTGWHNESFQGYADYMQTADFEAGLAELLAMSEDRPTGETLTPTLSQGERELAEAALVVMCAEAVPWRCHRSLLADALAVRGIEVQHIMGPGRASPHRLTSFAQVEGLRVTYPGAARLPL